MARDAFRMFLADPDHPALNRRHLSNSKKGRHRDGTWVVTLASKYRVLYVEDEGVNVWYWIGKHNDYENFIGKK
ncbi:hypothetical protein [Tautonia plasticadhaerens]|uniref:hypothetical protein n=1 Tax=Tautonia plasticadhaerens TaxID=2527974 RepID=UPI0011A373E0|nr:hypothetical protein [Tautonia plasticadhaerens]